MLQEPIIHTLFLVFFGAALIATLALYARQALLVSYIILGVILGPSVTGLVADDKLIHDFSHIGIIFLLFLMGLDLDPRELLLLLRKSTIVTLASSLLFALVGGGLAISFGYGWQEALIVGAAMVFSSTIIGLKLLPTTVLHHQRTGEIVISILLLQDLIAILLLLMLKGEGVWGNSLIPFLKLAIAFPILVGGSLLLVRFLLLPLIRRFDIIKEYIFLITIGWCLFVAEVAAYLGLSYEIGAFIAGVSLASSPASLFIAESLKPLRDFFLILFFFSLGAGFDLGMLASVLLPALLLALLMLLLKPLVFNQLLRRVGEEATSSREVGVRLGQLSEFSLLLALLAYGQGVISIDASHLIQLATLLTFLVSPYVVVLRYPTPIALSERLRRD